MAETKIVSPEVRAEIEALVAEHAWLVDHGQADRIHELYVADGRLLGIGPDLVGRDAIAAYGRERGNMTGRTARHICGNMRLVALNDGRIRGTVAHTLYRHDGSGKGLPEPMAVGDYEDVYVRDTAGRWRFAERRVVVVFESEAHRR
jgi:hypothetical protein